MGPARARRRPWSAYGILPVALVLTLTGLLPAQQETGRVDVPQITPPTPEPPAGGRIDVPGIPLPPAPDVGPRPLPELPADVVVGGQAAAFYNASDVGSLLDRSDAALGVEVQHRTPAYSDPRVRGYRASQIATWGDHGYFEPARQDLDTAVSKFDANSIRDVLVLKGPYSVRLGPGFAFLDIVTFDSPRATEGRDWELHGRSFGRYQINGQRMEGLQSASFGAVDWGIRATYDISVGNDYEDGHDQKVPSSYNSQFISYAAGVDLTPNSHIEFKGLRVIQQNVEFPGLFFDLNRLNTEAYSVRLIVDNQSYFDRLTADVWYNTTTANGDTHQGAKQAFLNPLISAQIPAAGAPGTAMVMDFSTTDFAQLSRGYRLGMEWGKKDEAQIGLGTDLNVLTQGLNEHVRFLPVDATVNTDAATGGTGPGDPFLRQDLGIPLSRMVDPGVYLDGRVPVGPRFTMHAGLRGDWATSTSHSRFITGNYVLQPNPPALPGQPAGQPVTSFNTTLFSVRPDDFNVDRSFDLVSTCVNMEYAIDEHLTALVGFGFAQRPPTLTELYSNGAFIALLQQGLNRTVGDPHLQPERDKQFDVGVRGNWGWVRGGVSGFYAWVENYITFDLITAQGSDLSQVVFANTDEASLAGGEMFAEVDVLTWLTPFITVSYVQGRDLAHLSNSRPLTVLGTPLSSSRRIDDTEALPGIPPLELRSGVRLHQAGAQPRYSLEFSARSVMGQNFVADSLNELPTSGFTIFDLRGYWQPRDNVLLTSGFENLGNKFYREHLDPRAGDVLFRPGINYYITAQLTY